MKNSLCVHVRSRNGFFHFYMVQNKIKHKYFVTGKPVCMCCAADVIPKQNMWRVYFNFIYFSILRAFCDCSDALADPVVV